MTEYTWATLYSEGLCSHIVLLRLVGDIKLHKAALALVSCVTNDNVEASHDWHHHTKSRLGHVPASMMMNQPVGRAAEDLFENHERVSTGGTTGSQNKNTCSTAADELALICTMHGHASLAFSGSQSLSCEKLYGSAGLP